MRSFKILAALAAPALAARMPVYLYTGEWNESDAPFANKMLAYSAAGASHLVLAFHVYTADWAASGYKSGSVKQLADMTPSARQELLDTLHGAGTQVILSTGGESAGGGWVDVPAPEYAASVCQMAAELGVDGVDFDLENIPGSFGTSEDAKYPTWNREVIAECKKYFSGYITSAPQTPYVMQNWSGKYGYDTYGFDRLLIQYYNQGDWSNEQNKEGMFGPNQPGSIPDLMRRNPDAPKDRFVVGKPLINGDGNDRATFTDQELKDWGCEAWTNLGWRGGFMFWVGHWDNPIAQMKVSFFSKPCPGTEDDPEPTPTDAPTNPPTVPTDPPTVPTPAPTVPTPAPTVPTPAPTVPTPAPTVPTNPPTVPTTTTTQPPVDGGFDTICTGGDVNNPVIAGCVANIKSQPYWVSACQANCLTIGPGGCLHEVFCNDYSGTTESLMACVVRNYPYCTL